MQTLTLTVQVFHRVILQDIVSLQKLVDLKAGLESEEPPEIRLGETATLEFFSGERFQSAPGQVADGLHSAGQIVGNLRDQVHLTKNNAQNFCIAPKQKTADAKR